MRHVCHHSYSGSLPAVLICFAIYRSMLSTRSSRSRAARSHVRSRAAPECRFRWEPRRAGFQCAEREQDSSDFCRHPITKFQPIDALHLACAGLGALHFLHAKGYGRAWKAQRRALATLMCVPAPQKIILVVRMVIGNANTRVRMRSRFGSDFLG